MQAQIYRRYAHTEIFNEYLKFVTKYVAGEVNKDTEWEKEEVFAEIDNMIDLDVRGIKLAKNPRDQEASVVALFFECIGNERIKGYIPLCSGYRSKYDLYAKWGNKKLVFEFKSKLKNILRDFKDQQKMFNEINCIVCWDVDDEDKQAMHNKGLTLNDIKMSPLSTDASLLPHATHQLVLSGFVSPIYIIDMKKVIGAI